MVAEDFFQIPRSGGGSMVSSRPGRCFRVCGRTVAMKLLLRVRTVPAVQRRTQIFVGHHHDGEPVVWSSAYFYM